MRIIEPIEDGTAVDAGTDYHSARTRPVRLVFGSVAAGIGYTVFSKQPVDMHRGVASFVEPGYEWRGEGRHFVVVERGGMGEFRWAEANLQN